MSNDSEPDFKGMPGLQIHEFVPVTVTIGQLELHNACTVTGDVILIITYN